MENKLFSEVFGKIPFSSPVLEALGGSFVNSLKISKEEKIMSLTLCLDEIIDESIINTFKAEAVKTLPYIKDIKLHFYYGENAGNSGFINKYWENILFHVSSESPFVKVIMDEAGYSCDSGKLIIKVKNNGAFFMCKNKIDKIIEEKLKSAGCAMKVVFKDIKLSEEEASRLREEKTERENKLAQTFITDFKKDDSSLGAFGKDSFKEESIDKKQQESNVILGKEINSAVISISEAGTEGERVVIKGYIFNLAAVSIKDERYIVSFDITDLTDSTTVKFFSDKPSYDKTLSKTLKDGAYVLVRGDVQFDKYAREIIIMARDINKLNEPEIRQDNSEEKRVELHLHTQMSSMDGVTPVEAYIKRAAKWGHKAIAITDHGVVQAFPDAMSAAKKEGIKVIYGVEGYFVDDLGSAVQNARNQSIKDTYIVFDIETTGLTAGYDKITEIGAVKIKDKEIIDSYSTFINPGIPLPKEIIKLTGITDDMLADAPDISAELPRFIDFIGDGVLVAHNAAFDTGFIKQEMKALNLGELKNTIVDTLEISRAMLPDLPKHRLNFVAEALGVSLKGHHRAVNDAKATAEIFLKLMESLEAEGVKMLSEVNAYTSRTVNYKKLRTYHGIILARNYTGLKNLYKLISMSHMDYFYRRPRIPKSQILKLREGLILGSACEAGELYQAFLSGRSDDVIENIAGFYDYFEIQPLCNNSFMIDSSRYEAIKSIDDIIRINKKIVDLGDKLLKPVVATCDAHFLDPEEGIYRKIIMTVEGFADTENQAPLYLRTTGEMLKEFEYLGEETAKKVVIEATNKISDMVLDMLPIPEGTFAPEIPGADEELKKITTQKAMSVYGDPLPEKVRERLEKELGSIIKNGFAVMYIIAKKLVWKSLEDGYLVGSRGSVGSSFVATMAGITEVNPLPAHYVCPNCKYSDFDSPEVLKTAAEGGSGCDMPDAKCPVCGTKLKKDGHDIPFETFLGFDGDKEPDIDLNFSGEYQQKAHQYTEEIFGSENVFKAGTIGTIKDRTAFGFVKKYLEMTSTVMHNAQINRMANGCTGIKRTTGQHPGGLMILPRGRDIHEFCPVQHPANDMDSNIITTHFDYHSISGRLLKLDLLGHDDPTVIRMLYDLTGVNPQMVPLDDKETMSLFESPKALGVTPEDIDCPTGTLGIPEFGTRFVIKILLDTKPKTFSDLLRISGLSHGTDVWTNNAQSLIESGEIKLKETISTRDSIMAYLISKGIENKKSFKIMEKVRKGKGLDESDIEVMEEKNVPGWYIKSCQKIKYMFPKAHAAAYVMMAFRIAYFKINYPLAYYASYFSIRAMDDFNYSDMCRGLEATKSSMKETKDLKAQKEQNRESTTKEKNKLTVFEIVVEFYARGYKFLPIDFYESDAVKFLIKDGALLPPLSSIEGLGATAAKSIVEARKLGEFKTVEDIKKRTSLGKSLIEILKENEILKGIPDDDQLSLFNF
ncbi:MAG: PolC-type DNA polymerase III [Lachnospiraceae bacterium]|nr:PolC-type DNA polymerase III [Lachnospiraceae bacterium]